MPDSNEIYIVANARPLFSSSHKSMVQACEIGEIMPIAIPKNTAPAAKKYKLFAMLINVMEMINKKQPMRMTIILPFLSENLPAIILMSKDERVKMRKKRPLLWRPMCLLKSGVSDTTAP